MAQDPTRLYDKTSLKVTKYDGLHRDYIAHAFRWGFISTRLVKQQVTRVLDIGCGTDCPLSKLLSSRIIFVPKSYLGVDLNNFKPPFNFKWASWRPGFNFSEQWRELEPARYDLITCLEVVEHMRMESVRELLQGAVALLAPGGRLVVSTPVANGRPAKNHINECTIPQLLAEFTAADWIVDKRFGTFANINDIKKVASPEHRAVMDQLRCYYGDEVISCFLAPLYADSSRNNIWIMKRSDLAEDLM